MVNQGAVPVDFTAAVGQVRLLIGDTDARNVPPGGTTGDYAWFSDDELRALLALYPDPRRAAVAALRTIAPVAALKLKSWSEGNLAVDGPAITKALTELATSIERGITASNADGGYAQSVAVGGEMSVWRRLQLEGATEYDLAHAIANRTNRRWDGP